MPLYEHVFLARQDISAQQVEALVQSFREILEGRGGSVGKTEYWGLRSLTYRIKKNRKAHYTLMNIDAPHEAVAELERQMSLSTDVIRFLTVRVDEHEAAPSAMMRRADRDEREGRATGATVIVAIATAAIAATSAVAVAVAAGATSATVTAISLRASRASPSKPRPPSMPPAARRIPDEHDANAGAAAPSTAGARPAPSPAIRRRRSTTRT